MSDPIGNFYTLENGPWPAGTTVAVWSVDDVSGGVPVGAEVDSSVAGPDGTVTFGGLTLDEQYTAFGHGGTQTFTAGLGDDARLDAVETDVRIVAEAPLNVLVSRAGMADVTGDGSTNDSAAIQARVDLIEAAGGGDLLLPGQGAVYMANLIAKPFTRIIGEERTVLKAVAGSSTPVLLGKDFASLTGKLKSGGDNAGGAKGFVIKDLIIDGNKANTSGTPYAVQLWGVGLRMQGAVQVRSAKNGIWWEATEADDFLAATNDFEGHVDHLKINDIDGDCWEHRGPHDTVILRAEMWDYGGWAIKANRPARHLHHHERVTEPHERHQHGHVAQRHARNGTGYWRRGGHRFRRRNCHDGHVCRLDRQRVVSPDPERLRVHRRRPVPRPQHLPRARRVGLRQCDVRDGGGGDLR